MNQEQFLPSLMIALSLGSSIPYWLVMDWRKALYWMFAAGLTAVVTY